MTHLQLKKSRLCCWFIAEPMGFLSMLWVQVAGCWYKSR